MVAPRAPKTYHSNGLGRAIMNDRRRKMAQNGTEDSSMHTTDNEPGWVKLRSVTHENDLDEFLNTAELADVDFTAERRNVRIIQEDPTHNSYLLKPEEQASVSKKHQENSNRLTVPRRPAWDKEMTRTQLERKEKDAFLDWRRTLADLQDNQNFLLTPFERNLEVWRQLWRVLERSDLVVQIVDARDPLAFRSVDLEKYVKEIDTRKRNLLLVNKADMMTDNQRKVWADYFKKNGIRYTFFSAAIANKANESLPTLDEDFDSTSTEPISNEQGKLEHLQDQTERLVLNEDDPTRILTVQQLEELFIRAAPPPTTRIDDESGNEIVEKLQIGLVGYPNVGKSSTINALLGAKKVSVSATPGKTKHFQTILLSPDVILCDCPGLVFPNFATTQAELVCDGVLPIDQLREFTGPAALVAQRIPKEFIEATYGIKINIKPILEGGTGTPTAEEVLTSYASARGYMKAGQGSPDESRAARYILKDYVNGKLLFVKPPPNDPPISPAEFNKELYTLDKINPDAPFKAAPKLNLASITTSESENRDTTGIQSTSANYAPELSTAGKIDRDFFTGAGLGGHVDLPFHRQKGPTGMSNAGRSLRKVRQAEAVELGVSPSEVAMTSSKKHYKKDKKNRKGPK